MDNYQIWSLVIAGIQGTALVLVLVVYYFQLRTMRKTQEATAGQLTTMRDHLAVTQQATSRQLETMRAQLVTMKESSAGQNLLALTNFIQAEDVREARRVVIEELKDRHFSKWSDEEKSSAAKVCSSYGAAGIILESELVQAEPIINNWGPSIRRCHKILAEFIADRQRPQSGGPTYWRVFDRLNEMVEAAQSSPAVPEDSDTQFTTHEQSSAENSTPSIRPEGIKT